MGIEFKLPELGENIASGDVINLLVKEGDTIEANQPILEIETDKAVVPVPASAGGKITKLLVKKGDNVAVGATLLILDGEGGDAAPNGEPKAAAAPKAEAPKSEAPKSEAPKAAAKPAAKPAPAPVPEEETDDESGIIPAGPATRRLARELGIDLKSLTGSGKHGRITPEDVLAKVKQAGGAAEPAPAPAAKPAPVAAKAPAASHMVPADAETSLPAASGADKFGPVRTEKLPRIRKAIAAQMVKSTTTIPHVTNYDDADVTELDKIRKGIDPSYFGSSIKVTLMPFVLKAVALSLKARPMLNAQLDEEHDQIIYKQYVNLGIAVDTPRGLVVPVLRDVDKMSIPEIARSLASLAERTRNAQFSLEDTRGGSFTISNLGAIGGQYSTPIINHPEVAILLLGRSKMQPVVVGEKIEPRFMMPLSLSYDHRLIDGAEAARFLNEIISYLQSPGKLLLAD